MNFRFQIVRVLYKQMNEWMNKKQMLSSSTYSYAYSDLPAVTARSVSTVSCSCDREIVSAWWNQLKIHALNNLQFAYMWNVTDYE